jgi:hypothetical protein
MPMRARGRTLPLTQAAIRTENGIPEILSKMLKALTRTGQFELAEGRHDGFNFVHVRDSPEPNALFVVVMRIR